LADTRPAAGRVPCWEPATGDFRSPEKPGKMRKIA
jgi:hypothetical protein